MRHNRDALDRWRIVPRVLHGVGRRELRTEILGTTMPAPLLIAPIGAAGLVRADSDVQIAAGAAASGTPYVFSSQGCNPMEDTARAMGTTPFWYQLYWSTDEQLVDSMIRRAERCGAAALVVTVDTTVLGWRPQDLDLGSLPFARGEGIGQYTSDARFLTLAADRSRRPPPDGDRDQITAGAVATLLAMSRRYPGRLLENLRSPMPRAAVQTFLDIYSNPGLSWDHLATLKQRTSLPVLVKGDPASR
jgi:isopentenyl diphosphate isomerase/L-lactate dehydrogenase-like FMN-dependent dehydrogenase